jgi:ribonuclease HI
MGIGWICIDAISNYHQFEASIENWPSSTRAELFALMIALLVSPKSAVIHIHTDSQALIHGFRSIITNCSLSNRSLEKTPNYTIWNLVQYIVDTLALDVNLHKVKAHDGNTLNDIADSLAKNGRSHPPITPVLTGLQAQNLTICFKAVNIESSIRKFFKNLFNAQYFGDFLSLHRNRDLRFLTSSNDINWFSIWNILSLDSSFIITSFANAHLKTFMIKNFIDELSVLSRIERLRSDLYNG